MQFDDSLYKKVADYVFQHSGIHYPPENYYQLDSRIQKLIKHLEMESTADLTRVLSGPLDSKTHQVLIDLATNNETYFYRDPIVFQELVQYFVPMIKQKLDRGEMVNIWSSAASTGQEIYSFLMSLENAIPGITDSKLLNVVATDISENALAKAKAGEYSQLEVQRGLPIRDLTRYFVQSEDKKTWKIKESLVSKVKFSNLNLLTSNFENSKFEIIFCRNVLIYQTRENKAMILDKMAKALRPEGVLVLGNTENTYNVTDELHPVRPGRVSFYANNESYMESYLAA